MAGSTVKNYSNFVSKIYIVENRKAETRFDASEEARNGFLL